MNKEFLTKFKYKNKTYKKWKKEMATWKEFRKKKNLATQEHGKEAKSQLEFNETRDTSQHERLLQIEQQQREDRRKSGPNTEWGRGHDDREHS